MLSRARGVPAGAATADTGTKPRTCVVPVRQAVRNTHHYGIAGAYPLAAYAAPRPASPTHARRAVVIRRTLLTTERLFYSATVELTPPSRNRPLGADSLSPDSAVLCGFHVGVSSTARGYSTVPRGYPEYPDVPKRRLFTACAGVAMNSSPRAVHLKETNRAPPGRRSIW